jgi:hypothetical protein
MPELRGLLGIERRQQRRLVLLGGAGDGARDLGRGRDSGYDSKRVVSREAMMRAISSQGSSVG